jgi:lysophospholipase L1-like esterase
MQPKKFRISALLASFLLLSFAPVKKPDLNVVFIGDSITHGTMAKDQSPPVYAGEFLQEKLKSQKVSISNQGVSGFTTFDFLPGKGRAWKNVRLAADAFYADKEAGLVFSIMLGTNDSAIKGPTGSPVAAGAYRENLKTITDSLLKAYPNCKVVINHPIWYSENTHNRGAAYMKEGLDRLRSYLPQIDGLVNEYHKTSKKKQVFLGDTDGAAIFERQYLALFKPENGLDGVFYLHPNKAGDQTLGKLWGEAIEKAVD